MFGVIAVAALLIGWPIARLAGVALERGPGAVVASLAGPLSAVAAWNSLWTGVVTAIIGVSAGTAAAIVTERTNVPGRRLLRAGMLLPMLVPPFVAAFAWGRAFGPRGLSDQLLGVAIPGLYGPVGIVLVLAVATAPLAWLIVAGALASRVEPDLERAARASGAGSLATFRLVTLPLLRRAILSAFVVAFIFAINAFGVPAVLGTPAGFATITTQLYQDLAFSADPAAFARAATLSLGLVGLAMVVVGSADSLLAGRPVDRTAHPGGSSSAGRGGWLRAILLGGAITGTTLVPLAALVLTALTRAVGLPPVPANWTLANFGQAVDDHFLGGLANSIVLAGVAATLVLGLGALGVATIRGRSRGLATIVTLGFAVPGSALAIAILLAYGGWLRNSLAIILVAYLAKFWALGHRQLAGSIDRLPPDAVRAARASGAGVVDSIASIVVPMLRPSIAAAWIVVFVFALHELTMSSLLYGPGSSTLAIVVLDVQQLGDPTVSAALAVLLTGIVAIAAAPLAVLGLGLRGRGRVAAERAW